MLFIVRNIAYRYEIAANALSYGELIVLHVDVYYIVCLTARPSESV